VTRSGIYQAITDLGYDNPGSPKTKFIQVLKRFYRAEEDPGAPRGIPAAALIKIIWDTGDDDTLIQSKTKNLNSVRASINADLMQLFEENKNPEGIVIGPTNVFGISDMAREKLVSAFVDSAKLQERLPLQKLADILSTIGDFVAGMDTLTPGSVGAALSGALEGVHDPAPGHPYLGTMERHYYKFLHIPSGEDFSAQHPGGQGGGPGKHSAGSGFYMAKYPVTVALFDLFVEKTGYTTTAETLGYGWVYKGRFQKVEDSVTGRVKSIWNSVHARKKVPGAFWYQPLGPGSTLHRKRHHPVVQISLADAAAFAAWAGKRLPTAKEWEAAARTPNGYAFPWGNRWKENRCNLESSSISDTSPVDAYPDAENKYGLADLLGNVMEWTADECSPLEKNREIDKYHIAKGGSWMSGSGTRLDSHTRLETSFTANTLGFRLAADSDEG